MTAAPIRLGIIGCGRATIMHHLPALRLLGQFEVTALADVDARALAAAGRHVPAAARVERIHEILPQVDAVAVATPTPSHADLAVAALEAGRAILLEKPVAMNLEECERMARAAARTGRPVLVAHNARWHTLAERAREIIQSGELGRLTALRSTYTHAHPDPGDHWHRVRSLGGGVLFNDGVHHFDLWRFLTGAEIDSVACHSVDSARFEDDTASISARLSNGALATCLLSFSATANSEVEIFGERASLLISLYRFDGLHLTHRHEYPGSIRTRLNEASRFLRALPEGLKSLRRGGGFDATYVAMWRHFAACCRGEAEPLCSLADGRAAVAAALACRNACAATIGLRQGEQAPEPGS